MTKEKKDMQMKILIFGGFLGSGKTSLLLQLAKYITPEQTEKDTQVVIIENEIGQISVDDKILKGKGYDVRNLFSGCVCCTMSGELIVDLCTIRNEFNPDLIIIEATGMAYPYNIRENIQNTLDVECRICALVDAKRWKRISVPLSELITGQLTDADVILINKIDSVNETALVEIEAEVKARNSNAAVYKVSTFNPIDEKIFDDILGEKL